MPFGPSRAFRQVSLEERAYSNQESIDFKWDPLIRWAADSWQISLLVAKQPNPSQYPRFYTCPSSGTLVLLQRTLAWPAEPTPGSLRPLWPNLTAREALSGAGETARPSPGAASAADNAQPRLSPLISAGAAWAARWLAERARATWPYEYARASPFQRCFLVTCRGGKNNAGIPIVRIGGMIIIRAETRDTVLWGGRRGGGAGDCCIPWHTSLYLLLSSHSPAYTRPGTMAEIF